VTVTDKLREYLQAIIAIQEKEVLAVATQHEVMIVGDPGLANEAGSIPALQGWCLRQPMK
jgi:hypothetical protein